MWVELTALGVAAGVRAKAALLGAQAAAASVLVPRTCHPPQTRSATMFIILINLGIFPVPRA
jgi:hypothetical protein